jgi:hypothetical protein
LADGVQAFLVVPWFVGAIYRREQSPWVWKQYTSWLRLHGEADALFGLYLYAIFYAALILIPYAVLALRFPADSPTTKQSYRVGRLVLSIWFAGTSFFFGHPIFAFMRSLEDWNGWVLGFWIVATIGVSSQWRNLEDTRRRYLIKNALEHRPSDPTSFAG